MKRTLYEVTDGLCDEAVRMWERDGALMTTAFAIGHSRSLFAQPLTEAGCEIGDDTRVRLQALLGASAGAVFIGRIDESYIKYQEADAPELEKGELARLADTDPSIKTALVVHTIDVASGQSYTSMAILGVDDEGEREWEFESYDNPQGTYVIDASKSLLLMDIMTTPMTDAQLRDELDSLGWTMADSDDMPRYESDDQ